MHTLPTRHQHRARHGSLMVLQQRLQVCAARLPRAENFHARSPVSPHVRRYMQHSACALCREIRAHIAEPFWYIHVTYRAPEGQQCTFHWRRGHIFDHAVATVLYEMCVEAPLATITRVSPAHFLHDFKKRCFLRHAHASVVSSSLIVKRQSVILGT